MESDDDNNGNGNNDVNNDNGNDNDKFRARESARILKKIAAKLKITTQYGNTILLGGHGVTSSSFVSYTHTYTQATN